MRPTRIAGVVMLALMAAPIGLKAQKTRTCGTVHLRRMLQLPACGCVAPPGERKPNQ